MLQAARAQIIHSYILQVVPCTNAPVPVSKAYRADGEPRLRRLFGYAQLVAFSLNFMSSWEVICVSYGAAVYNGGPAALSWGCVLVVFGALAQAMVMAELGSILPIAGAQYHWTELLAPPSMKRFVTWVQGWVTWFAWYVATKKVKAALVPHPTLTAHPRSAH